MVQTLCFHHYRRHFGNPMVWTGDYSVLTHRWSGCIREPSGRDHRLQGVETRGCWCWPLQFQWIAPVWMDSTIGYTAWSPIITTPGGHFSRFFFVSTVRQLCCASVRLFIFFSWLWFTEHTYIQSGIFFLLVFWRDAFFEWSPPDILSDILSDILAGFYLAI